MAEIFSSIINRITSTRATSSPMVWGGQLMKSFHFTHGIGDRQVAEAVLEHQLASLLDRIFIADGDRVPGHDLIDFSRLKNVFHRKPPLSDAEWHLRGIGVMTGAPNHMSAVSFEKFPPLVYEPIGIIETCFVEKFGVPRQSGMVPEARGVVRLLPVFSQDTVLHLAEFSHIWVIYDFHKIQNENHPARWTPTIQPPRIDAPNRIGVFASRSPHRPNPIGMSVVRLEAIRRGARGVEIEVSGVDILDGSPVIDLKPYVPYSDRIEGANSGWIQNEMERFPVEFSPESERILRERGILELARQVLEWDPRPRSQRAHVPIRASASVGRRFAFRLADVDLHWEVGAGGRICVRGVKAPNEESG